MSEGRLRRSMDGLDFARQVKEMLEQHNASDLQLKEPVFVTESTEPADAFKFLSDHHLRACPVRADGENFKIVGTMDQRDAVVHVTEEHKAKCQQCRATSLFSGLSFGKGQSFKTSERPGNTQLQRTSSFSSSFGKKHAVNPNEAVGGIRQLARSHPFYSFPPSSRLVQVAEAMANGEYVVGITGGPPEKGGLKGLVDQGTFIEFLAPVFESTKMTVRSVMRDSVVPVRFGDTAIKAFELMLHRGTSGVAVINEDGAVLQNVSTSDAKIYFSEGQILDILHLPIEEYLSRKAGHKETKAHAKTRAPISVCHAEDDLCQVVTRLVKTGYHRVWVVDIDRKPVGILSLTDVFRKVARAMRDDDDNKSDGCVVA